MAHYIGLDVGTGSTRACLINENGDILSVAVKDIKTWHEKADYYVCETKSTYNFRNNRVRTSGRPAAASQDKLSANLVLIPYPSRELDSMRLVRLSW